MALNSKCSKLKTIANMGLNGINLIMGINYRFSMCKYGMNENNIKVFKCLVIF